jgi:uncharacterized repeat protein (TIGR03809 family)
MTHRLDVAHRPDLVARWCTLAEQRLEYLTELFKTGRWRRYYSDVAFLENIQEAKTMVALWRDLSVRQAAGGESAGLAILDVKPGTAPIVVKAPREARVAAALAELVRPSDAPSVPAPEAGEKLPPGVELMQDRYPLLRNLVL